MKVSPGLRNSVILLLLALLAALCWLPGCLDNLCTKRLYIYRDAAHQSPPPADTALLIADPAIVAALLPEVVPKATGGLPWAPEQPAYASDCYQLSIDGLDDHPVYQGLCMNITPSFVCEVRPGSRRVLASLNFFGPWGRQSVKETTSLSLEPGGVYFLYPDGEGASQKTLRLKVERLPVSYTAALRAQLVDWQRGHTQGRSLEN